MSALTLSLSKGGLMVRHAHHERFHAVRRFLRLLIFHVDAFACTITQKGRSSLIETPEAPTSHIEDGLLVLASVEAGDEAAAKDVQRGTVQEIEKLASQLKVRQVMLLPFAHLFAEPAPAAMAVALIDDVATELRSHDFTVERPPFGWFHSWDMQAKGHPLSRVARTIRPAEHGTESAPGERGA